MILHLIHTCSALNYQYNITVPDYKADSKSKGSCIIVEYKDKNLIIPLSNIASIEL